MKTLIQLTFFSLFLISCGDEISYPATYVFESDQEIGTSIITKEANGELLEVSSIQSLSVPLCGVFTSIQEDVGITSITLMSESELEISINNGSGMIEKMMVPYIQDENKILEAFGLEFDGEDKIISKICNTYTFAPSANIFLAESNFCNVTITPQEKVFIDFEEEQYQQGDTLGLCLINKIYKLQ